MSNLEIFGAAVLRGILDDHDFFGSEESEGWCELMAKFGYIARQIYDPNLHGEIDFAEPGDSVWIFTDAMKRDARKPE